MRWWLLTLLCLLWQPVGWAKAESPLVRSEAYLVVDAATLQTLAQGGDLAKPRPIASITKLMTAIVVLESGLPLSERLTVTKQDRDRIKGTSSPLAIGATITRAEALHLALMASDNRAAMLLARHHPGGREAFVRAMNVKARMLGMSKTRFVDPAGLSPQNVASIEDLVRLARAASQYPLIRQYSTDESAQIVVKGRTLTFKSTNAIVRRGDWPIRLQKTGFTREAGRCLVMIAPVAGKEAIFVLMNSVGKYTRVADARRLKDWIESGRAQQAMSAPTSKGRRAG